MENEHSRAESGPQTAEELRTLVRQAQAGDASVLPALRRYLDEHPEIWDELGDLARLTESVLVKLLAADHPLAVEAFRRRAAALRAELEGADPTPLERLLVAQVVANWLEVAHAQMAVETSGGTLAQANFRVRRAEIAQRKYLAAIKALSVVRALPSRGLVPAPPLKVFDVERERA